MSVLGSVCPRLNSEFISSGYAVRCTNFVVVELFLLVWSPTASFFPSWVVVALAFDSLPAFISSRAYDIPSASSLRIVLWSGPSYNASGYSTGDPSIILENLVSSPSVRTTTIWLYICWYGLYPHHASILCARRVTHANASSPDNLYTLWQSVRVRLPLH